MLNMSLFYWTVLLASRQELFTQLCASRDSVPTFCFFPTEGMYHSNTTVSMQRKQLNDMIWRVVPQATCWSVPTSLNVLFQKDEKMGHPMERLATFKHITLHIWIWMKNSKNLQINVFGLDYGPLPNLPPPSHASSFDLLHCEIWVVWN